MALDLYSPCPCGSGKKFKWCCQPIHVQIDHAMRQDADGQHEAALRTMAEVVAEHPANPEAWGRQAQLLYQNDRLDEAENALQKAFEINPKYPFGHLLRGLFRQHEGEIAGALLLFRKAAEYYDPEARDILSQVYALIADCELKLRRPIAAHAALKIAHRCRPSDDLQKGLEDLFGEPSHLPAAARKDYVLKSPHPSSHASRLAAWERARALASSGKLIDLQRGFEQLTNEIPEDASAWYNVALARAWLGENARALEALDRYVQLEPDEARAGAAWAMAEVLRFGQGMEDEADYVEHHATMELRDAQRFFAFLQQWEQERRLTGVQIRPEESLVTAVVLDKPTGIATGGGGPQNARLGAFLMVVGPVVRLSHTNPETLERVLGEFQERAGPAVTQAAVRRGPATFNDVLNDALIFPLNTTDQAEVAQRVREHVQSYFEETWVHRPLRSLGQVPPIDAAGHAVLRKKLIGVVQVLQDCAQGQVEAYDFDRLRRKLGLITAPAPSAAGPAAVEPSAMSAAELAALVPESLSDEQLEAAYQAAQKLDARDLAGRFAGALVARPPRPERPDRYPWYSFLVQSALSENNLDAALDRVNEGEKADCEHNEGRRRNEYELWRGRVLTKRGDTSEAVDAFQRLIERVPANLRFRSTAAEAMLSARQGAAALRFAEQGLAKSREQNDRDGEQQFMELVAAAKKQVG
jgi:tetratricopeptide (TPR) repeat protein